MKSSIPTLLGSILSVCVIAAQAQQAPATQKQNAPATVMNLTAKSANVSESGTPIKINLIRWSTDDERLPLLAALNPALAPAAAAGRGGRGGRGTRGPAPEDVAPDPALAEVNGGGAAAGRGGARGAGARGAGRGGRGGGDAAAAKPPDPISNLTDAIGKAPTVGYIWTNEVVGYSIKYALRIPSDNGGERIILAAERRLGGFTNAWKPTGSATPTDYEFTIVELKLDAKGIGEGKTSLATKVVFDDAAKTLALDNYAGAPVMLASVKK